MADEKKEKWTNYLALTTVLIAVCATLSTFKGGGYSTKSLLSQQKASDQWAFFEAKSIKAYLFDSQKENLNIQKKMLSKDSKNEENVIIYQNAIDTIAKKVKKYEAEKAQISIEAKKFEKERDECKEHSAAFGMAVIFLQVAILLSSIAALIKRKYLWYISMLIGVFGIVYFVNGFLLFFQA